MTASPGSALFAAGETSLPRFRQLSDLTLDLLHHDGRVEDRWLGLDPYEFQLLWRLAREPQRRLSDEALMAWAREQASAELAARRLQAKLAAHGLGHVLARHVSGFSAFGPSPGPRLVI
jgi:two-component system, OmpR family, response regulator